MVDSMIILFPPEARDFSTNGMGSLPDAVSCVVLEELNGEFELEMKYPITGRKYKELSFRKIILAKPNPYAKPQPFRIYGITKPINGIVTVNAEHISYDMSGIPVSPFTAGTIQNAFLYMKDAAEVECPFSFSTDKDTMAEITVSKPSSMRSVLGGQSGSILDIYGGEYEFDKFKVKLHNHRGANRGVSIRYGKNLTDLKQDENCASVYTGVYPYWYSEQDGLVQLSEKIITIDSDCNFTKIFPLDATSEFQDKPTEELLRRYAELYIKRNNIGVPKVSIKVSFVQLAQSKEYKLVTLLENVYLGDTVNVEFPELGVSATAKCVKTKFDVLTDKYINLELGNEKSNIVSEMSIQSQKIKNLPSKTEMEKFVDNATMLISGGLGGHVIMHSSTGGKKPDEILIMDTDDIHTAVNVWRWNQNGFGHSSTGYNGPYTTALTQDGAGVADFIKTGKLDGSLITAGSIKSQSISQEYKSEVTNEINDTKKTLEQKFIIANNELLSLIQSTETDLRNTIEEMGTAVLRIDSSRGTVFKNNAVSTILTVSIFRGSKKIENIMELREEFGASARLEWQWLRLNEKVYGVISATDPMLSDDGFTLTLTPDKVDVKVTFRCNLII